MLLQDVDIPEQVETARAGGSGCLFGNADTRASAGQGGASGPPAAPEGAGRRQDDDEDRRPTTGEEEAATNDAASTMAAEVSDAAFRRAQSDTELVRAYRLRCDPAIHV